MKIFQLWVVFNSCVFMMIYFMTFLILKYPPACSVLICVSATTFSMVLEVVRVFYAFDAVWCKILVSIIQIPVLQATALILSKKKDSYALFTGFSSSNFVLAGNIVSCMVVLASRNYPLSMAACTLGNTVVYICLNYMIKDICRQLLCKEIVIWMCIIPAMCYITFYLMLYFPVYFEQQPETIYAAGSLLVTVIVMYILLLQYISARSSEKNLLWRNRELHAYIHGVELQTESARAAIRDLRIMRHDMRHKDHLLTELINKKNYREALAVLQKDITYLEKTYLTVYCENVILNSILCGMAKQAEQCGIRMEISCSVPDRLPVDNYDLALVTANLTENAIQATAKLAPERRFISVTIKSRDGEQLFMEIRNPCHEKVIFSKKTGLPVSARGGDHGLGMISVQEFVQKYHAHSDCYIENQIFIVRILIYFT